MTCLVVPKINLRVVADGLLSITVILLYKIFDATVVASNGVEVVCLVVSKINLRVVEESLFSITESLLYTLFEVSATTGNGVVENKVRVSTEEVVLRLRNLYLLKASVVSAGSVISGNVIVMFVGEIVVIFVSAAVDDAEIIISQKLILYETV